MLGLAFIFGGITLVSAFWLDRQISRAELSGEGPASGKEFNPAQLDAFADHSLRDVWAGH